MGDRAVPPQVAGLALTTSRRTTRDEGDVVAGW